MPSIRFKKILIPIAALAVAALACSGPFAASTPQPAATLNAQNSQPSAAAVLAAANTAMGGDKLHSLQYSATGYVGVLGQAYAATLDDTWPRFALASKAKRQQRSVH